MGAVEVKQIDSSSNFSADSSLTENAASGNSSPVLGATATGRGRQRIELGDLGMRIARNGTWSYRGSPITRLPLVKLFASVLRREADGQYWLTTPAERGRIDVEDAPFLAVALEVEGHGCDQQLIFRTNIDEFVTAGPENPLRIEAAADGEPGPYILLRDGLEAKLARPVFYELVEHGTEEPVGDRTQFGVWSRGVFFRLGEPEADWE